MTMRVRGTSKPPFHSTAPCLMCLILCLIFGFSTKNGQKAIGAKHGHGIDYVESKRLLLSPRRKGAFQASTLSDLVDLIGFAHWLGYACVALILSLVATTTVISVQARIREHAVLQTLGLRPARVFRLVVAESLLMCLIGGVLGTGLALAVLVWTGMAFGAEGVTIAFRLLAAWRDRRCRFARRRHSRRIRASLASGTDADCQRAPADLNWAENECHCGVPPGMGCSATASFGIGSEYAEKQLTAGRKKAVRKLANKDGWKAVGDPHGPNQKADFNLNPILTTEVDCHSQSDPSDMTVSGLVWRETLYDDGAA